MDAEMVWNIGQRQSHMGDGGPAKRFMWNGTFDWSTDLACNYALLDEWRFLAWYRGMA